MTVSGVNPQNDICTFIEISAFKRLKNAEVLNKWRESGDTVTMYLGDGRSLVDRHKYFVQQRLKVVACDAVHHEAFQRRNCQQYN